MNSKDLFSKKVKKSVLSAINGVEFEIRKPTVLDMFDFFSGKNDKKDYEKTVDALVKLSFQKGTNNKFFIDPDADQKKLLELPFNVMSDSLEKVNSVFFEDKKDEKKRI